MAEIVYVLTNPAMPYLVKIGHTSRESMTKRLLELFTTGVPVAFDYAYAAQVENCVEAEKLIHEHFSDKRVSPRREFFFLTVQKSIKAIKPYELVHSFFMSSKLIPSFSSF